MTTPTLDAAVMYTALADIAGLLRRGLPEAAIGCGVRQILDARPIPGLRSALPPGATGEDVARLIGSVMIALPVPFTVLMRGLTRDQPRIEALPCGRCDRRCTGHGRPLTVEETGPLHLPVTTGARAWHRSGIMTAGGAVIDTSATLIPDLVPARAMDLIRGGTPIGTALPDLARVDTTVELCWPAEPGLAITAVICLGGQRAGITAETLSADTLDRLAKGA